MAIIIVEDVCVKEFEGKGLPTAWALRRGYGGSSQHRFEGVGRGVTLIYGPGDVFHPLET